jgi:hypothetical protein
VAEQLERNERAARLRSERTFQRQQAARREQLPETRAQTLTRELLLNVPDANASLRALRNYEARLQDTFERVRVGSSEFRALEDAIGQVDQRIRGSRLSAPDSGASFSPAIPVQKAGYRAEVLTRRAVDSMQREKALMAQGFTVAPPTADTDITTAAQQLNLKVAEAKAKGAQATKEDLALLGLYETRLRTILQLENMRLRAADPPIRAGKDYNSVAQRLETQAQTLQQNVIGAKAKGVSVAQVERKIEQEILSLQQMQGKAQQREVEAAAQRIKQLREELKLAKATAAAGNTGTGGGGSRQKTGLFQGNLRDTIGNAIIGGGFPLLFGQGAGASVGGAIGGLGGGALGGTFGFGLSIVGTALGAVVDTTVANLKSLASALNSPNEAITALETSGFRVSNALKFQVEQLQAVGRAYDAQSLVLQEVERRLGAGAVRELSALNQEQKRLQDSWSDLTAETQRGLVPALIGAIQAVNAFVSVLNSIPEPPEWAKETGRRGVGAGLSLAAGTLLPQLPLVGPLAARALRETQRRGRAAVGSAPATPPLTPQQAFADETTRISRARELEDMQRDIQRGELDLIRRREDVETSIADQRRAESEYEKEVADYRWSVEQRVLQLRADAIRAQSEVMQSESDLRVARIGLSYEQPIFNARPGLEQEYLEASKNLLEVQEQTEAKVARNKIETELRIEELKREQINRERQLEREKEQLEQRKDQLLRGRIQLERGIADYQMQVADYQRETARKIFDAWRQMNQEMQAAAQLGAGSLAAGSAPGGTQNASRLVALAKGAGFQGDSAAVMAAIALAESGGNPKAHNPRPPDNSYGLWQINMLGGMGPERRRRFGLSSNEQLFDPATNANAARGIYESQGYNAWSVYSSGAYKQYLPAARAALNTPAIQATAGATQGPNTRPEIPLNQAAMLNGKAVIWNGNAWEKAGVPGAGMASPVASPLPVDLSAPARPGRPSLPGVPDTAPMQRGMAESTEKVTQAQKRLLELSKELADVDRQRATNALMRVAQGPNRVREAEDRLRTERYLADETGATTEREQERLELIAGQRAETEQLETSVATLKLENEKLNQLYADSGGKQGLSNEELAKANGLLDDQLVKQARANELNQEALKLQQERNALLQTESTLRTAAATGAGLRAGLIGSQARALEQGLIAGNSADRISQDVEATKLLEDQQLIWGNLEQNIVAVSDAISGGLTRGLADIVTGARDIREVGREVLDSIAGTFLDSAQQQLSVILQRQIAGSLGGEGGFLSKIMGGAAEGAGGVSALQSSTAQAAVTVTAFDLALQGLSGTMLGASGGGLGGLIPGLGGLIPGLGGLFGGGATGGTGALDFLGGASPISTAFDVGASLLPGIPFGGFLAEGGDAQAGKAYWTGEKEPELFIPGVSGRVVPRSKINKALQLEQISDQEEKQEIDVRYEVKEIAGERYVTEQQFRKGMARAAKQGSGMAQSSMRNSGASRSYVGLP